MKKKYIVGITGASGSVYARQFLKFLATMHTDIYLIISPEGRAVIKHELGVDVCTPEQGDNPLSEFLEDEFVIEKIHYVGYKDFFSPPASGSFISDGMVICPCSMGTISRIRHGISSNLMERAADVMIKEKRKLILLARETPFSSIHLENMLALSRMGVVILPAAPAFYQYPKTLDDVVNFMVGKLADQLGIENSLFPRWQENS